MQYSAQIPNKLPIYKLPSDIVNLTEEFIEMINYIRKTWDSFTANIIFNNIVGITESNIKDLNFNRRHFIKLLDFYLQNRVIFN